MIHNGIVGMLTVVVALGAGTEAPAEVPEWGTRSQDAVPMQRAADTDRCTQQCAREADCWRRCLRTVAPPPTHDACLRACSQSFNVCVTHAPLDEEENLNYRTWCGDVQTACASGCPAR